MFKPNKNKCKIIINNEKKELNEFYKVSPDYKNENGEQNQITVKLQWKENLTDLSYMFADCSNLINISNAKNLIDNNITNLAYSFKNCTSLKNINDLSYWNTQNVANMNSLFRGCKSLDDLSEICNWNTSNVIDMSSLFNGCENLKTLNISEYRRGSRAD